MKIDELNIGMDIDNKTSCEIFQCSPQGGMRRSLKTNSLVLISNKIHSVYNDLWKGDIFLYTGMGQKGDHNLNFM